MGNESKGNKMGNKIGNKIEVLTVQQPPITANVARTIGTFIGLIFAGLGVIMMLTIILIIPGIFAVLAGLVVAVLSTPKASVDCPACGTDNKVTVKLKQLKCEGCNTVSPLKWVAPEGGKSKWTSWSAWRK